MGQRCGPATGMTTGHKPIRARRRLQNQEKTDATGQVASKPCHPEPRVLLRRPYHHAKSLP